jgi:signal transduction histidine kinase
MEKADGLMEDDLDRANVLITSDDAEFSRAITGRWQAELLVPAFTLVGSDLRDSIDGDSFSLAIVGEVHREVLIPVLVSLSHCEKPLLFVSPVARTCQEVSSIFPKLTVLRQADGWVDTVVLLAQECLKCCQAVQRAARAEHLCAELEAQATLGRYMLDMRHTLNNAMTSLLGNAELLLLEPAGMTAESISQIDTVKNMAMRMNEVLARFSSLEKELKLAERQVEIDRGPRAKSAASGL